MMKKKNDQMFSNVNNSSVSKSGKTFVDTHEAHGSLSEPTPDASASLDPLILTASETFSPAGPGLLSP
jgi:hypothetical protein